jgi:AbrB family looped-hinge helix DNA binding protein
MSQNIEAIVSCDERGQVVLPKDLRKQMNINAGDKLAIVSCKSGDQICCLTIFKANELSKQVKSFLGPLMKDLV